MKVVIVAPYFHPHVGGVEVYTLNMARRLKDLGWQVVIVTTGERRHAARLEGVTVHYLAPRFALSNTPIGLRWRREFRRIYRLEEPDVINAHTPVPFMADVAQRSSRSIPFVLTYHNDLEKSSWLHMAIVKVLHRTLIDRTLRRSTKIITTSDYYVNESPYLKPYRSKIRIVSPGVDCELFNPDVKVDSDLAARYWGKRLILFVGSMGKSQSHKGLDVLIRAFALVHGDYPDAMLVVVGQGDGAEAYKSMAAAAGVARDIEFTGYIDNETLAQYYKLATIFAMPSTNRSEGFGMVYMEASAVGTPVVGSRIGGVPYAVKDNETGLLVEPQSEKELSRALRRLLEDASLAERLGNAGAARARAEFDWQVLAKATSEIFEEACGSMPVEFA